jgi:hypothetical protein
MDYDYPETLGNVIIPSDKLIFCQRGRAQPPTSCFVTDFPQTNPLIDAETVLGVVEKSAKPEDVYVKQ